MFFCTNISNGNTQIKALGASGRAAPRRSPTDCACRPPPLAFLTSQSESTRVEGISYVSALSGLSTREGVSYVIALPVSRRERALTRAAASSSVNVKASASIAPSLPADEAPADTGGALSCPTRAAPPAGGGSGTRDSLRDSLREQPGPRRGTCEKSTACCRRRGQRALVRSRSLWSRGHVGRRRGWRRLEGRRTEVDSPWAAAGRPPCPPPAPSLHRSHRALSCQSTDFRSHW